MACNKRQIQKQLAKILNSLTFKGGAPGFKESKKSADLLAFIVERNLTIGPPTEVNLLTDFFKVVDIETAMGNGTARVAVGRLREKLVEYQKAFGEDDPVTLSIERNAYKLDCAENPNSLVSKLTVLGFDCVDEEEPIKIEEAITHFKNAISLDPNYAKAYAGLASALLTKSLHSYDIDPKNIFLEAESAVESSLELDPGCWQGLANQGAINTFGHRWDAAKDSFSRAAEVAPIVLSDIGGYGLYLLATAQYAEATNLAMQYRDEGFNKYVLLNRAALYFYALREYGLALDCLQQAVQRNRHFWRTHLGFAFVYLATNEPQKAVASMLKIGEIVGTQLWPGFNVICLAEAGLKEDVRTQYEAVIRTSREQYLQPVQIALAHIGVAEYELAIKQLNLACEQGDPFTAWLHLWPMLDPIERLPNFIDILKRRGFPPRRR